MAEMVADEQVAHAGVDPAPEGFGVDSGCRLTGLITTHRDGRRTLYAVENPHVITLIRPICDHIAPDGSRAPDPPHRS